MYIGQIKIKTDFSINLSKLTTSAYQNYIQPITGPIKYKFPSLNAHILCFALSQTDQANNIVYM